LHQSTCTYRSFELLAHGSAMHRSAADMEHDQSTGGALKCCMMDKRKTDVCDTKLGMYLKGMSSLRRSDDLVAVPGSVASSNSLSQTPSFLNLNKPLHRHRPLTSMLLQRLSLIHHKQCLALVIHESRPRNRSSPREMLYDDAFTPLHRRSWPRGSPGGFSTS